MLWSSADPAERLDLSMRAAICRSPKEGLLVHPHLETCRTVHTEDEPPWIATQAAGR
jgi:hypothetical protein